MRCYRARLRKTELHNTLLQFYLFMYYLLCLDWLLKIEHDHFHTLKGNELRCCRNARWESCWLFECWVSGSFLVSGFLLWILAGLRPFWQLIRQLLNLAVIHFFTAVFQRDEAGSPRTDNSRLQRVNIWFIFLHYIIILWFRYWQAQMIEMTACYDSMPAKICDAMKSDDSCTYIKCLEKCKTIITGEDGWHHREATRAQIQIPLISL